MRVLLTVPSLDPKFGGPTEKAHALRRALDSHGWHVTRVGVGEPTKAAHEVRLRRLSNFHGTPIPRSVGALRAAVQRADLVHILGFRDPVGTIAALTAARSRIPYVLEPVGMHRPRVRSVLLKRLYDTSLGRRVVDRASLIIATSSLESAELIEDGVPPERVVVRANGLPEDAFRALPRRGAFRERIGVPDGAPLALHLGRITRKKGLPELVRAVSEDPRAHLAIVGPDDRDGSLANTLRAAEQAMASDRVHIMSEGLWGDDRAAAFADADVFCLYSMTENFGIAAAEAAAAGVATIVSDQCGVAEWLGDGCEVVPYGDVHALSARLRMLLDDPERRARLGQRGREAARALTWDRIAQQQIEIYERVLGRRG